jgi:hypothetical protein
MTLLNGLHEDLNLASLVKGTIQNEESEEDLPEQVEYSLHYNGCSIPLTSIIADDVDRIRKGDFCGFQAQLVYYCGYVSRSI